ncbi:putative membrane protein [Albidovulum inexpectatum]|uniref:Putative membrane protein n=1 Tax=Albidovulum inexpectatum TaxID=196587 RepID=A0A2S5JDR0_9RHOB|nr:TIGR01620 family protein [Albidovulum inexpectatum]PPB79540.1 putative membrane protein [Albidovulum inexpectatum]
MTGNDRTSGRRRGPVVIEIGDKPSARPDIAPPVPDAPGAGGRPTAMQILATRQGGSRSRLGALFFAALSGLIGLMISVAAWRFIQGLIASYPLLGWVAAGLAGLTALAALLIVLRELRAYARLARLDRVHAAALEAVASGDLRAAGRVVDRLVALYSAREDTSWGRTRLAERRGDVFDADALLALAEAELVAPLDRAAVAEVERAARQVATVTAIVPLALADVVAALVANLRMVRRIAEIYGGRAGVIGSWRLLRAVMTHLVATGAVAVGDDLVQSVAGGGLVSKLSRRFGEGIINGALTARVGLAAIDVCRPLPFAARPRPRVSDIVRRALTGLFGSGGDTMRD